MVIRVLPIYTVAMIRIQLYGNIWGTGDSVFTKKRKFYIDSEDYVKWVTVNKRLNRSMFKPVDYIILRHDKIRANKIW
jgi:hypothetical protein